MRRNFRPPSPRNVSEFSERDEKFFAAQPDSQEAEAISKEIIDRARRKLAETSTELPSVALVH